MSEEKLKQYGDRAMALDSDGKVMEKVATVNSMELFGLSTDTKPTTNLKIGTSYFEIDTTNAYMWDGSTWRLI